MTDKTDWAWCEYCARDDNREATQLDPSWEEQPHDGFIVWIDPSNKGEWVHRHNFDTFQPRRQRKTEEPKNNALGEALCDLLVDPESDKADSLRMLLMEQGAIITSGRDSDKAKAIQTALVMIGESAKAKVPGPGERCSVCKHVQGSQNVIVNISESIADKYLLCESCPYQFEDDIYDYRTGDFFEVDGKHYKAHGNQRIQRFEHAGLMELGEAEAFLSEHNLSIGPSKTLAKLVIEE